jgi:hypothetical protein
MDESTKRKIADACLLLLAHGFTLTGPGGVTKGPKASAAPSTTPTAPTPAKTADGRSAYTCGNCHEAGHNARSCPKKSASPAAPAKTTPAAPKASTPVAPVATAALDSLDFDLGDLGGAPVSTPAPAAKPAASKPASAPKASAPKAAPPAPAPAPTPEPTDEASDSEVSDFISELDNLLP